jgi:hypothetical protein
MLALANMPNVADWLAIYDLETDWRSNLSVRFGR